MKRNLLFDRLTALADPIRARLLLVLERHELTVSELCSSLQLPQSTVSRHLRALANAGWVISREDGTSNRYRMGAGREPNGATRKLWLSVREEIGSMSTAARDAERVRGVIASRQSTSQKFFASSAAQWDKMRASLFGARAELSPMLGLLEDDWTAADLGCGTGQLAEAMAPFVRRVIAVDESPDMLRAARTRLAPFDHVEVRHGTLEALPVDPESLDVAVLSLVLHYVPEPAPVLAGIARALKRNGRVLVLDMMPHDRAEFRETMGHVWPGFSVEQLSQWTAEAGFATCRMVMLPSLTQSTGPTLFAAVARKL